MNSAANYLLLPPQQYELARLARFECLDNLLMFAVERSQLGVQLNFPVSLLYLRQLKKKKNSLN